MLHCAVLSFEHTVSGIMGSARYQVMVCTSILVSLFSLLIVLTHGIFRVFFFAYYTRPADHTAKHRTITSAPAHLDVIKSQVAPKSWASFSCPLHNKLTSVLRKRSELRQPPADRRPEPLESHTKTTTLQIFNTKHTVDRNDSERLFHKAYHSCFDTDSGPGGDKLYSTS